jgi:putative membrane protein
VQQGPWWQEGIPCLKAEEEVKQSYSIDWCYEMKKNFGDHSANERTYLAWIRTGIAIMAFGFLIEKFTLFLDYIRLMFDNKNHHADSRFFDPVVQWMGFAFMSIGVFTIFVASIRFYINAKQIDSNKLFEVEKAWVNTLLGLLIGLAGLVLAFLIGKNVILESEFKS